MDQQDNILNYTSADIERYHNGLMTAAEMNAIEKAALDDPMLADAMEGYSTIGAGTANNDLTILKNQLKERIETKKVIPFFIFKNQWLKIAVLIVLIAGAGWMLINFNLFNTPNKVAVNNQELIKPVTDAIVQKDSTTLSDSGQPVVETNSANEMVINNEISVKPAKVKTTPAKNKSLNENADGNLNQIAAASGNKREESAQAEMRSFNTDMNKKAMISMNSKSSPPNIFRGQVVDENNSPLPFANITNKADNIGTYADAKGNFTLTSPDTVLNVSIKSVGFANSIAAIKKEIPKNKLILHPDTVTSTKILAFKKVNNAAPRQNNLILEEPEPLDGWGYYDIYIANNIKTPVNLRLKQPTGNVEVSFEINPQGEPINITVEKSLCEACDKEAIRLIKEGPKWKKGKTKRVKIKVPYQRNGN